MAANTGDRPLERKIEPHARVAWLADDCFRVSAMASVRARQCDSCFWYATSGSGDREDEDEEPSAFFLDAQNRPGEPCRE